MLSKLQEPTHVSLGFRTEVLPHIYFTADSLSFPRTTWRASSHLLCRENSATHTNYIQPQTHINQGSQRIRPTVPTPTANHLVAPDHSTVTMAQSDLDQLVEMGFQKERAELALKKGDRMYVEVLRTRLPAKRHKVMSAIEWLDKMQDKSMEELSANAAAADKGKAAADVDDDMDEIQAKIAAIEDGVAAKSLVCNECGKRFKNSDLATFHANKRYAEVSAL
jgi:hypothetical protein